MFMAAAPQGQHELDFEAEEAAILAATQRLPLRLVVEETGNATFLGERLCSDEGSFEALHLSCHGDIDPALGPILLLETAEGRADKVGPGASAGAWGRSAAACFSLGVPDGAIRTGAGRAALRRLGRRARAARRRRRNTWVADGGAVRAAARGAHRECRRLGRLGL